MENVCPICNNPLRQYGKDFYVCDFCETYFDKDENIVLTEQEWLQTCDTEQLAEWIFNDRVEQSDWWYEQQGHTKAEVLEWLKQPHREEIHK